MIPQKQKWRKQVQISISASELAKLDRLVDLDTLKYGNGVNRSKTIRRLVAEEIKRRQEAEGSEK